MNRLMAAALAVLLALTGLLGPSAAGVAGAAQVEGNTYTSSGYPFSLTWDDSWFILDEPSTSDGVEEFSLGNGASFVLVIASDDALGDARIGLASILLEVNSEPTFSNVTPILEANGDEVRQTEGDRSFAAVSYTQDVDGTDRDFGAYIETRTLEEGASLLSVLHLTPLPLYETEALEVQELLAGLTIQGADSTPVETDETETPEAAATPTVAPEPSGPPQAFVSGNFRIAVVAGERAAEIDDLELIERDDKEWVVLIADVTNWSNGTAELTPDDFQLRYQDDGAPNGVAPRSTAAVADLLDVGPDDITEPIPFAADETQRLALVFQVDVERPDPVLAFRVTLPLDAVLSVDADFTQLPDVNEAPELIEASVDLVRNGGTINLITEPDGEDRRVDLIGVDAPAANDCFADESAAELEALAENTVYIEIPDEENEDNVYLWVERRTGSMVLVNRQMVSGGFAGHDPGDTGLFSSWISQGAQSAESREIGLWEDCTGPHGITKDEAAAAQTAIAEQEEVTPTPSPVATEEPTAEPTEEATEEPTDVATEEAEATPTRESREQDSTDSGVDVDAETEAAAEGVMFRGNSARTGIQPGPGLGSAATLPWTFRIGFPVISSPAVVDGVVYVGSLNSEVYALDAFSGPPKWTFKTDGEVFSSPAVANGFVYIGSNDNNLYAIDAETGRERWRFEAGNAIASSPAVVDGVVYVGSDDTNLYAIDAETGQEKWALRIGPAFSSPAVVGGVVYIGAAQSVFAVDVESGEEIWRVPTGDFVSSSPAVVNGTLYVGNDGGDILALNAENGDERWRSPTGGPILSSPAVVDGTVFIGSDDGSVYAVDAESGEERWTFETGDAVSASIAVADGVVYAGSLDGFIYGIDGETGTERWRTQVGPILASPAIVDGVIYTASGEGNVSARRPFDVLGIPGLGGEPDDQGTPTADDSDAEAPAPSGAIDVAITIRDLAFDPSRLTVPAGMEVVLILTNEDATPHNFSIDDLEISTDIAAGQTERIIITAPPGVYQYYCNVSGHKESGMVGELIVE